MNYIDFFALNTDYGSSRTRSFSDIFPTYESFQAYWQDSVFATENEQLSSHLNLIYFLLLGRYANSTIASSDEERFKLQLFTIVWQYAPTWKKRLEIQKHLQSLDINSEKFLLGSEQVFNTALNPADELANDYEKIQTVNQQQVNYQKRDKFKALAILEELLKTDVTSAFLERFQPLFRSIVAPQRPLYYTTTQEDPTNV